MLEFAPSLRRNQMKVVLTTNCKSGLLLDLMAS